MYINNQPILVAQANEPQLLLSWMNHQSSLTDKLQRSTGSIQLKLLSQNWISPTWWDTYLLQIKDETVFQREILMSSHNVDYWYGRTIIPQSCYELNPEFFNRLEKESIRNLIFGNQEVHRSSLITYSIDEQCIEYHWVKNHIRTVKGPLWVRLAEFSYKDLESFYLIEILLPELEAIS